MFIKLLYREMALIWSDRSHFLFHMMTITLACVICIMAMGDYPPLLKQAGPGMTWCVMVLVTLLQAPTLFYVDYAAGFVDDVLLSPLPLVVYLMVKALGAWLRYGMGFIIVVPLLLMLFHVPLGDMVDFWVKATIASIQLAFIALFIATLNPSTPTPRLFGFFLGLPLYLPTLIAITLPLAPLMTWTLLGVSTLLSIPLCLIMGEKALLTQITE